MPTTASYLRVFVVQLIVIVGQLSAMSAANAADVLILDSTVSGGASSQEAAWVISRGYTVNVVNATTWAGMTAADFASYKAIILGDPTCGVNTSLIAPAVANSLVWASAVSGNVLVIGADPIYHYGLAGAQALVHDSLDFVLASDAGKTGAYITLSCYYHSSPCGTPVPLLDGFGSFTLGSFTVCGAGTTSALNDVHIVASHPALATISDTDLSDWGNSVHENFESWATNFSVLALARSLSGSYTAGDGTVGYPYILARGVIPIGCGNGRMDPGEQCDDENNTSGDGCDAACKIETTAPHGKLRAPAVSDPCLVVLAFCLFAVAVGTLARRSQAH